MIAGDDCKFGFTEESIPIGNNKIIVNAIAPYCLRIISQIFVTQPDGFVVIFVDDPNENTNQGVCTPACEPEPCCSLLMNYSFGVKSYFTMRGEYLIEAIIVGIDGTELAYDSINVFIE